MKALVYAVSAFFLTAMAGCAILDEYIAPVNAPASGADLAGTYSGPDGTIVIKKVEGAHLMRSQEAYRASQDFATLPAKIKRRKRRSSSTQGR